MPYLTGDTPEPNSFICRSLRIPDSQGFLFAVNGAISELLKSYNWEEFGTLTQDESVNLAIEMWQEYIQSDVCMIGTVMAYATTIPPKYCLPCDGASFLRVDYPKLYERLEAAYIIDADTFRTPDLRSKFVIGASVDYPVASVGGAVDHTMTLGELVSHDHSTIPHSHAESVAAPTAITIGAGVPAPSALPAIGVTGTSSVTVNSTGGGAAFPTIPPYEALNYCIVAR